MAGSERADGVGVIMIALAPTSPDGVDASALDIDRSPTDSRMLVPLVPYSTLTWPVHRCST